MPTTPGGIQYEQYFAFAGQRAYSETFTRDNNTFTVILGCQWYDAQDFRREMLGHSEPDSAATYRLARTVPFLNPYTARARCQQMELIYYGRKPTSDTTQFDADATALIPDGYPDGELVPYYEDPESENWFWTQWCVYRCMFTRFPYNIDDDAGTDLAAASVGVTYGKELWRYVIRQRNNNVRELRIADYGFVIQGSSPPVPLPINSFMVTVEAELIYTWFQLPYDKLDITTINAVRGKINGTTFDQFNPTGAWPIGTVLFVDVKNIDIPYEGADGNLYIDPQFIFRLKQNKDSGGTVRGHNYFYDSSTSATAGQWVLADRRLSSGGGGGGPLYESSNDFMKLFTPLP